jgi:hypothetical protein
VSTTVRLAVWAYVAYVAVLTYRAVVEDAYMRGYRDALVEAHARLITIPLTPPEETPDVPVH